MLPPWPNLLDWPAMLVRLAPFFSQIAISQVSYINRGGMALPLMISP